MLVKLLDHYLPTQIKFYKNLFYSATIQFYFKIYFCSSYSTNTTIYEEERLIAQWQEQHSIDPLNIDFPVYASCVEDCVLALMTLCKNVCFVCAATGYNHIMYCWAACQQHVAKCNPCLDCNLTYLRP